MKNKVALVTGSSKGIGRRILCEFAKNGYSVVINYNNSSAAANDFLKELNSSGFDALKIKADVSKPDDVKKLFSEIIESYSRIDVVVNNAAIISDRTIINMSDEEWGKVIDTDLSGSFYVLREAAKYMIKQKSGSIINISSIVGMRGNFGEANYSAAKSGIFGLTKTASRELGRFNICVNCVLPGFHLTDMGKAGGEEYHKKALNESVIKKTTSIDELSRFIVFLSELKSVSGQIFNFDSRII